MYGIPSSPSQDSLVNRALFPMPAHAVPGPQPQSSTTSAHPLPATGTAMSVPLQAMGRVLERVLVGNPTIFENVRGTVRPLQRIANALSQTRNGRVQQKGIGGTAVSTLLAGHRGPIVFLGMNGMPEFYFEQHDGHWQAYHGGDRRPCVPNRSPDDVLQGYLQRPGTIFNVLHAPLTDAPGSAPASHADVMVIDPEREGRSDSPIPRSGLLPGRHSSHLEVEHDGTGSEADGETHRAATSRNLRRSRVDSQSSVHEEGSSEEHAATSSTRPARTVPAPRRATTASAALRSMEDSQS